MDTTIGKKALLVALQRAAKVADRKATMPILSHVLLTAGDETLYIAATSLHMAMTSTLGAETTTRGSAVVPLHDLLDRVKQMPDGPVRIAEGKNHVVTLKAVGTARQFKMHGLPAGDFPDLPKPPADATALEVPGSTLASLIGRAAYAICSDDSRMQLHCALITVGDGVLRMVATDGHRLAKAESAYDSDGVAAELLVPQGGVANLRELAAAAGDGAVRLETAGAWLYATVGETMLAVQLSDAKFPPYDAVIPKRDVPRATVPRQQLLDAVRAVSVVEARGGIKAVLNGSLRVTATSPEHGEAVDEVSVEYDGPERSVGFSARYLVDALSAIGGDEVLLDVAGELDPVLLVPVGEGSDGDVAVVMPMRV